MSGDVVAELRGWAQDVQTAAFWRGSEGGEAGEALAAFFTKSADLITSQAAEMERLTKRDAEWTAAASYGDGSPMFTPDRLEKSIAALITRAATAERLLAEARAALTPSAETKAAYSGEFTIAVERHVNDDEVDDETDGAGDPYEHIMVPWTTIKEIMAAISARTLTNGGENGR